jgi:hypothetical protein
LLVGLLAGKVIEHLPKPGLCILVIQPPEIRSALRAQVNR